MRSRSVPRIRLRASRPFFCSVGAGFFLRFLREGFWGVFYPGVFFSVFPPQPPKGDIGFDSACPGVSRSAYSHTWCGCEAPLALVFFFQLEPPSSDHSIFERHYLPSCYPAIGAALSFFDSSDILDRATLPALRNFPWDSNVFFVPPLVSVCRADSPAASTAEHPLCLPY